MALALWQARQFRVSQEIATEVALLCPPCEHALQELAIVVARGPGTSLFPEVPDERFRIVRGDRGEWAAAEIVECGDAVEAVAIVLG